MFVRIKIQKLYRRLDPKTTPDKSHLHILSIYHIGTGFILVLKNNVI